MSDPRVFQWKPEKTATPVKSSQVFEWTPEEEPERKGTATGAFLRTMGRVPENLVAKGIMAAQGQDGASVTDRGPADKFVNWVEERNRALSEEYEGAGDWVPGLISKRDIADFGQDLAFSGVSTGSSLAAGAAAGPIPVPGSSTALAMAAGGATAHRMDSYMVMNDWLNRVNAESMEKLGRGISPAEEKQFKADFEALASKHGFWEAGPEAIGNVLEIALMKSPLGKIANIVPDGVKGKVAKEALRFAGLLGAEMATETVTQIGQTNVEVEAGMSDGPERSFTSGDDILESAREVLPGVLLLTGFMHGGSAAYHKAKGTEEKKPTIKPGSKADLLRRNIEDSDDFVKPEPKPDLPERQWPKDGDDAMTDLEAPAPATPPRATTPVDPPTALVEAAGTASEREPWPVPMPPPIEDDADTAGPVDLDTVIQPPPQIIDESDDVEDPAVSALDAAGGYRTAPTSTTPRGAMEAAEIDAAAQETDIAPTEEQIETGEYDKGHINLAGLRISIENPAGSVRKGTDPDGKEWESEMTAHYGYFDRTEGAEKQGDEVDVFVAPTPNVDAPNAYIVDQANPKTGDFDEHKVVAGVDSIEEAEALYMSNYEDGWKGMAAISEISIDDLKGWLADGKRKDPFDMSAFAPDSALDEAATSTQVDDQAAGDTEVLPEPTTATGEAGTDDLTTKTWSSVLTQPGRKEVAIAAGFNEKDADRLSKTKGWNISAEERAALNGHLAKNPPTETEAKPEPPVDLTDHTGKGERNSRKKAAEAETKDVVPEKPKKVFRVQHDFAVSQPSWGADQISRFGKNNEGFTVEAADLSEAKKKIKDEHRLNPFYLKIIEEAAEKPAEAQAEPAEKPEAPKHDIMKEIAEISDEDLDALLDGPAPAEPQSLVEKNLDTANMGSIDATREIQRRHPDLTMTEISRLKRDIQSYTGTRPADPRDDVSKANAEPDRRNLLRQRGLPDNWDEKSRDMRDAAKALEIAAKHGVEGAAEAWKGIYELFGGKSLKSFPGGIDEDTYAKAKPHFQAALDHCIETGKSIKDFVAIVIEMVGEAARPYLKRFIKEVRDGKPAETTPQEDTADTAETVDETVEEEEAPVDLDEEAETETDVDEEPVDLSDNTGKGEKGDRKKLTAEEKAKRKAEREARAKEAEEKKKAKEDRGTFENVGYVWDPENMDGTLKGKSPKTAAKAILDAMVPARVWNPNFPSTATPGLNRFYNHLITNHIRTFKEFLRAKWGIRKGSSVEQYTERVVADNGIDYLRDLAREYGEALKPLIESVRGAASIMQVVGRVQAERLGHLVILEGDQRGSYPPSYNLDASQYKHAIVGNAMVIRNTNPAWLYTLFATDYTSFLADEQDVLLSEINIHNRPRNKTVIREGLPDYGAESIKSTEDFNADFQFNGVGFGTQGWINQEERSRVTRAAYNAFKDLAALLNANFKGVSIGGKLAVQFANLGHKSRGAAAAYFPGQRTINFTRDSGDGTLSHEWFHGLHDIAEQGVKKEIEQLVDAYRYIYDFEAGGRMANDLLAKDSRGLKRLLNTKKQKRIEKIKEMISNSFEDTVRKETDYYATAKQLSLTYTSNREEMAARAFESFVFDTLEGTNNYLVNDFVAAGRVGGKGKIGDTLLVYPAGVERETFNELIQHFVDGLVWDEAGNPSLKEDYQTIDQLKEQRLQEELQKLLDTVEARYDAIWASEPSSDGLYWYRFDETALGPMLQPDGYSAYDKKYKEAGQNGSGAVGYLTQLHPDDILDYKLTNIVYEAGAATYIKEGGQHGSDLSKDGEEAHGETSTGPDGRPKGPGQVGGVHGEPGAGGHPGTIQPSGDREGSARSDEGDGDSGNTTPPAREPGNYQITDPHLNDPKSINERFLANLSAIKTLKLIEEQQRSATAAEKDVLAQYSGWGGLGEVFSWSPSERWAEKAELIKAVLTSQELMGVEESAPTAYYTPVPVGDFIWRLAQRLGFKVGAVLDPATGGNGLFFGTMPSDLGAGVSLHGIEMDGISARIASKLYENANIENLSFEDSKRPINRYALTVTNVPFNSGVTPHDKRHNKKEFALHNYFINKMLNLTAKGNLSIMITDGRTMDKPGEHLVEFSKTADLVGAIRLPSGIYNSTDVVTDILVFRKKIEGSKFEGIPVEDWTTTGTHESTGLEVNNYFIKHPEMVAGKFETIRGRWGDEKLRVVGEGSLETALERIAAAFPADIVENTAKKEERSLDDIIPAPGTIKEGGFYVNESGQACLKENGKEFVFPTGTKKQLRIANVVKAYVGLLDQVFTTLRAGKAGTAKDLADAQAGLKSSYDAFVKQFGPVSAQENYEIITDATDSAWVLSLEEFDSVKKEVVRLADIFTKNITETATAPTSAQTDEDALLIALNEFGYPNLEFMASLRGDVDVDVLVKSLAHKIIENPETGSCETMDQYLSGNIRAKLAVAKEMAADNPEYEQNVRLLEGALPAEIPPDRITAKLGATWIKPKHIADFITELLKVDSYRFRFTVNFNPANPGNEWGLSYSHDDSKAAGKRMIDKLNKSVESTKIWGTNRVPFLDLMQHILKGSTPTNITFRVGGKTYQDTGAILEAVGKMEEIQAHFQSWLFSESWRSDEAVQRFNERINTSVPMKPDGSHLTLPGKSLAMLTRKEADALGVGDAMVYYPQQLNAVWHYLTKGNTYLAHEVGLGKTATMITAAMEARRIRGKKKIVMVTLNDSTMGQMIAEAKRLYPMANIIPIRLSGNAGRKNIQLHRLAVNDFDIAIMRQSDLNRIGLSPQVDQEFIQEELQELREALEEAKKAGARIAERDIQTAVKQKEQQLKKTIHEEDKEKNLYFDDVGIDLLIVDEAHAYKNVPFLTRHEKIMGLNPTGSPTAEAFFRKTKYLNMTYPKQDGLIMASGTPLTNSLAELYNLQRMLNPKGMKAAQTWSFDRWVGNYASIGAEMEWDAIHDEHRAKTVFRRIVNAGRLLGQVFQNIHSVKAKDTPVKRPKLRVGEPQRVVVKPNQYVLDYKQVILDRANQYSADPKNAEYLGVRDNPLRMYANMSLAAIDQRLLTDPGQTTGPYTDTELQEDSKIAKAREIIFRRWQEEAEHKGVQLVFADLGVPKKAVGKFKPKTTEQLETMSDEKRAEYEHERIIFENQATGKINTYDELTKELVKKGIPRDQIAFIHDADDANSAKKDANLKALFQKVKSGEIRVLIGSTKKAGTGVNVQERVSDIHHLDVWWNYSEWEQRNGRGIRAGNIYAKEGMPGVYVWNYVTETTVDATRWDKVFAKGRVLNAVLEGDINLDIIEDISDEIISAKMMAAEGSGNPLAATQAQLMDAIHKLRFEQTTFLNMVRSAKEQLSKIPDQIDAAKKLVERAEASGKMLAQVTAIKFVESGKVYVLEKHAKDIAAEVEKRLMATKRKTMGSDDKIPLVVFGTHTETEATETVEVEGADGKKTTKEKKVKQYTFSPLPVQGDILGLTDWQHKDGTMALRRFNIHGDVIPTVNKLGKFLTNEEAAESGKRKMTKDEAKAPGAIGETLSLEASINRSLGAAKTHMANTAEESTENIKSLESSRTSLEPLVTKTFPKADLLTSKTKELEDVDRQIRARGEVVEGNIEDGLPIAKFPKVVRMLDDVAAKEDWGTYDGRMLPVEYNEGDDSFAFKPTSWHLQDMFANVRTKFDPIRLSRYNVPSSLSLLDDARLDHQDATPKAVSVADAKPVFWFGNDSPFGKRRYFKVDPVRFQLLERMFTTGSWRLGSTSNSMGMEDFYLIHQVEGQTDQRDAYMKVELAEDFQVPKKVKQIVDEKGPQFQKQATKKTVFFPSIDKKNLLKFAREAFPEATVWVNKDGNVSVRIGKDKTIEIKSVTQIDNNTLSAEWGWSGLADGETVIGAYHKGTILISAVGDVWTIRHESYHALEDAGLVTREMQARIEMEVRALQRKGKFREVAWGKKQDRLEARAEYVTEALEAREFDRQTTIGRVLQTIADFIDGLVNLHHLTAKGVVRGVESGKLARIEGEGQAPQGDVLAFQGHTPDALTDKVMKAGPDEMLVDGVAVHLRESHDMGKAEREIRPPQWLAKRFPKFAKLFRRQQQRLRDHAKLMSDTLKETGTFWRINNEHQAELSVLIFSIEGNKLKDVENWLKPKATPAEIAAWAKEAEIMPEAFSEYELETMYLEQNPDAEMRLNEAHYEGMEAWATKKGASPEVVQSFIEIRRSLDKDLLTVMDKLRTHNDVDISEVQEYRRQILKIQNYFPHMRYGNHSITVVEKDGENVPFETKQAAMSAMRARTKSGEIVGIHDVAETKEGKWVIRGKDGDVYKEVKDRVVYYTHFDAMKPLAQIRAKRELKKLFAENPEYKNFQVSMGLVNKMTEEVYTMPIPIEAIEQVLSAAAGRISDPETEAMFRKLLPQATADVLKSRGWASHAIQRKDIPGHETENLKRVLFDYKSGLYGWLTKMDAARDFTSALTDINARTEPVLFGASKNYVYDMLENSTEMDRFVANMRAVFFAKYLGANVKTAVLNLTQNIVAGWPRLGMEVGGGAANKLLVGAMKQLRHQAFKSEKALNEEETQLLTEMLEEGQTQANYTEEIMGEFTGGGQSVWNKTLKFLGWPMMVAERFNRSALALAAFQAARSGKINNAKTLETLGLVAGEKASYDQAKLFAESVVEDAHFVYGKVNRPEMFRGSATAKFMSSAYTFRTFTHNLINLWKDMYRSGGRGRRAVLKSLAAIIAIGGITSIPLYKTFMHVIRQLSGDDWGEEEVLAMIPEDANWLRDILAYGFPSLAGVSIGGSVGMELPVFERIKVGDSMVEQLFAGTGELIGIPGAIMLDAETAIEHMMSGNPMRGMESVLPVGFANIVKAWRMYNEGLYANSGRPIVLPGESEPRKIGTGEFWGKVLGFQPTSVQKGWDLHQKLMDYQSFKTRKQSDFADRLAKTIRNDDRPGTQKVLDELIAWNREQARLGRFEYVIDIRASLRARMSGRQPPKYLRGKAMELKERMF